MRIAVCISGQPRTWRLAIDNIKSYFDVDAEVDYFIHTWDTNTFRLTYQTHLDRKDYLVDENEFNDIRKSFNPKLMEYDKYTYEKYGTNWMALFYSFMKSIWLKRKYEIEYDFRYDIVIKTRFDINFYPEGYTEFGIPRNKFYIHEVLPMAAYHPNPVLSRFPWEINYLCFDDVYFYSDSITMDIISNIYKWNRGILNRGLVNISQNKFIEDSEFFCGPGTLLYRYLSSWNIQMLNKVPVQYYVVRKEVEGKGYNSITDWKKIYEFSRDYYKTVEIAEEKKRNNE